MDDSSVSPASGKKAGFLRNQYNRMLKHAQGKHAWRAMAIFAFIEASCFPVPPDVMLLPMMLADRKRAIRLAAWCTMWSLIGGMAGYAIGYLFWDTAGLWIIHALHIPEAMIEALRAKYSLHAYWIAIQGFTPIPFKLVTISAGLAHVHFGAFLFFAAVARSIRFIAIEGCLVYFFGEQAKVLLEKYLGPITVLFLVAVVLGFILLGYLAK